MKGTVALLKGGLVIRATEGGQDYKLPFQLWDKLGTYAELDGLHVTFETLNGLVVSVEREEKKSRQAKSSPSAPPSRRPSPMAATGAATGTQGSRFQNPYNFVPAPPRPSTGPLADAQPVGWQRWEPDRWTGRLAVRLTTVTPLLLPDASHASVDANGHRHIPVRMVDSRPYLPPTTVKGVLRSAYEAITNSRFGVWGRYDEPLGYRMGARDGLSLVPARLEPCADGETWQVRLLPGMRTLEPPNKGSQNRGGGAYAARIPMYPNSPWEALKHGERVDAWLCDKGGTWTVKSFGHPPDGPCDSNHEHQQVSGFVMITNRNIGKKRSERLFFWGPQGDDPGGRVVSLPSAVKGRFERLIGQYQSLHTHKDLYDRTKDGQKVGPDVYLSDQPDEAAWSRHIYLGYDGQPRPEPPGARLPLVSREPVLCYAKLQWCGNSPMIEDLFPVSISRALYSRAPSCLLPLSHHPAMGLGELSPADRVFGWVRTESGGAAKDVAWRGLLRVGATACESGDALETFGTEGLPLAILASPQPSQARFYAAANVQGEKLPQGMSKGEAYGPNSGLRGRKVYVHHRVAADTWKDPMIDRTQSMGRGEQEYRRPQPPVTPSATSGPQRSIEKAQRDSQKQSIQGWVKPGVTFRFDLHVTNVTDVELGALLWLLRLKDDAYLRMGGGKPLGFGSVRLELLEDESDVRRGTDWAQALRTLDTPQGPAFNPEDLEDAYRAAVAEAAEGTPFEDVTFIRAFLAAARGNPSSPVHYPRMTEKPDPEGKNYKWFTENERTGTTVQPRQHSLPELWQPDPSLPLFNVPMSASTLSRKHVRPARN